MTSKTRRVVLEEDVFSLTPKAQKELHGSATSLAPAALEVLILIDGQSTAGETAERVRTIDRETVFNVMGNLLYDGLIDFVKDKEGTLDFVDFFQTKGLVQPSVAATAKAKKESAATAALLQQQGYFVRIARRSRSRKRPEDLGAISILVIEDEPTLASMLGHVLENEGYKVRIAKNRDEIVVELRRAPKPDLVLLDVMLPDIDGFLVLLRMRQHPVLKDVPVVMLTAKATRDAVIRGLAGGADGYITKPFEIEVLIKAVSVVLGFADGNTPDAANPDLWPA